MAAIPAPFVSVDSSEFQNPRALSAKSIELCFQGIDLVLPNEKLAFLSFPNFMYLTHVLIISHLILLTGVMKASYF